MTLQRILCAGYVVTLVVPLSQMQCGGTPTVSTVTTATDLPLPDLPVRYPAPTVLAVSPSRVSNSVGGLLTITGKRFRAGATAAVGYVQCSRVVVESPTTITCQYPGQLMTCARQDVTVTHPDDLQTGKLAEAVELQSGAIGFQLPTLLPAVGTAASPDSLAVGDLDGDKKLDMVHTNRSGGSSVGLTVRMGVGDGTFLPGTNYATGTAATGLALADINGDTHLDAVVANNGSNDVSVLLGSGTGSFAAPVNFPSGTRPEGLAVGDFNSDGKPDLLVANSGAGTVSYLQNATAAMAATPAFAAAVSIPVQSSPALVAVGDLNNDERPDFVVSNSGSSTVSVRIGDGAGGFMSGASVSTSSAPYGVKLSDVNQDSQLDLIVGYNSGTNVGVYLGTGMATFGTQVQSAIGFPAPRAPIVADMNNDDRVDLIVASSTGASLFINVGSGKGGAFTGATETTWSTGGNPFHAVAEDLNGDGLRDVITTSQVGPPTGAVNVHLGRCR